MELHILDFIMWFVIIIIYWNILDRVSNSEFTEELGSLVGCFGVVIITIIYIMVFMYIDWHWSDLFKDETTQNWIHFKL